MSVLAIIKRLGLAVSVMASPVFSAPVLLEGIVATVDDKPILVSEFRIKQQQTILLLRQQNVPISNVSDLNQRVLDDMIHETLESNLAKTRNIQISDLELNRQVELIAQQNQLLVAELRKAVEGQGDWATYLTQLRKQMLLQRIKQNVLRGLVTVDEKEVEDFLKRKARSTNSYEYEVAQILIPAENEANANEEALKLSQSVYEKIQSGMTFSEASVKYSADRNALSGGRLGWLNANNLPDSFLEALLSLKVGEVSRPIISPLGYHLLQLQQKRSNNQVSLMRYQLKQIFLSALNYSKGEAIIKLTRLQLDLEKSLDSLDELIDQHSNAEPLNEYTPWWVQGRFDPQLEQAVQSLQLNRLSDVIETNQGWHLVMVTKSERFDATELVQREQARGFLIEQNAQYKYAEFLRKLRDQTAISINQSVLNNL